MSDNGNGEVGYKRPPAANRFKAGVSGNPKGRPKGPSLKDVFLRTAEESMDPSFAEYVRADPDGTKLEAVLSSLFRQAHYGNQQAIRKVLALYERFTAAESEEQADNAG